MKNNWKFPLSVVCIILSAALLLAGCMAAIASSADTTRPYELSNIPQALAGSTNEDGAQTVSPDFVVQQTNPDLTEPPVSQEELKAKFSAMYGFSNEDKTISVISESYLREFWNSNYEKEVIHSLSVSEVMYIVQDSIRVYNEYDTVILPGFSAGTSDAAVRFPALEQRTITPDPDDRDRAREDVRVIIEYRMRALSSPKAFFTVGEMMEHRSMDLEDVPDICQEVFFYIPDYSADTNRDKYLTDGNYSHSRSKFGVFCFSYFNRIVLFTRDNPETLFPTNKLSLELQDGEVMYLEMSPSWLLDPEHYGELLGVPSFIFNTEEQTFYLTTIGVRFDSEKNRVVLEKNCADFKKWPGDYEKVGDKLYLYPFDIPNGVWVFDCDGDGGLILNKAESNALMGTFEDKSVYQAVDFEP